jgi:prepilin-type processing-associated H-X9-DG protein
MKSRPRRVSFTLIEVLFAIMIISALVALLVPALREAKEYGKMIQCTNNCRQLGQAMLMYAHDRSDTKLPNLRTSSGAVPAGQSNYWYWECLTRMNYLNEPYGASDTPPTNGVWRCPSVRDEDFFDPFAQLGGGGYGINGGYPLAGGKGQLIIYGDTVHDGGIRGSVALNQLTHPATTWLVGDSGGPKSIPAPNGGYWTIYRMWYGFSSSVNDDQPAGRHRGKVVACMADGHLETWPLASALTNKWDLFCQTSL